MKVWAGEVIGSKRVILAVSTCRLVQVLGDGMLLTVLPIYVVNSPPSGFPFPASVLAGLLLFTYDLVGSVLQPGVGALLDGLGRPRLFAQGGMIMMGAGSIALVFVDGALDLIAIRLIQGIGRAMVIPASMVLIAAGSEKGTRGGAMGLYSTILMAGLSIGLVFGGGLQAGWGPEAALCSSGALSIVGAILMQVLMPRAPSEPFVEMTSSASVAGRGTVGADIVGLSIAMFLVANSFSMIAGLESEFNTRLQQSVLGFSMAFSAFTFTRLIVQLPLGRLADRVGYRLLIGVGLAALGPATALVGYTRTTSQFTGVRIVQGVAAAAVAVPSLALGARISGAQVKGKQLGIITMSFGFGMAFGPLVASALSLLFFELPFLLSGILTLMSAWIVHRFVRSQVEE